ncbi:hypothetical protein BH10PSE4_BH10PSE4_44800 [soil metagenome]
MRHPPPRPRQRFRAAILSGLAPGLAALLVGCASLQPTGPGDLGLLDAALSQPLGVLRARSEAGEARAQYAMAILYAHGRRGVAVDVALADSLRGRALAPRGFTPITTYIAGLRGRPGRVAIITVPRYELDAVQALRIDRCVDVLARGLQARSAMAACGGVTEYDRLDGALVRR